MYLFRDKEKVTIETKCKLCMKNVEFEITLEEYENIKTFPIKKTSIHGEPEHQLIVFINKSLEVERFEIEESYKQDSSYSVDLTRKVLGDIGLNDLEIELYFKATGRDVVSIGELALLIDNLSKEDAEKIANRFVGMGLFKVIPGITKHYNALPPYAALISQLNNFGESLSEIKGTVPPKLNQSFTQLESQADSVKKLKQFSDYLGSLREEILEKVNAQNKKIDNSVNDIEKVSNISNDIVKLEGDIREIIEDQVKGLGTQFNIINTKMSENIRKQMEGLTQEFGKINSSISRSMQGQVDDLTNQLVSINSKIESVIKQQSETLTTQLKAIKTRISKNLKLLRLGIVQKTVEKVVEKTFNAWIGDITEDLNSQLNEIKDISNDGLMRTKISLNRTAKIIDKASKDGLVKTNIALNRQIDIVSKISNRGVQQIQDKFDGLVLPQIKNSITGTIKEINEITQSASKSGSTIKGLLGEINASLREMVEKTGNRISTITEDIGKSFDDLRNVFSTQVIQLFENVLNQILDQLKISEITTNEFWEQAKKVKTLTMKDIWFIRSIEAAKAHINDEIPKSKARILIVTPELTDINVDLIKSVPSRVNVRLCCRVDTSNKQEQNILADLKAFDNINIRNSERQDIWGVNRDYEEVIVCVLSETTIEGTKYTEIAGIGSVIEEHIKIFVPLLEDAWLGGKKIQ